MMSCMIIIMWWFFFFKQKTAYEMRISDWSSDVCSSDLSTIWWPRPPMPTAAAPPPWPLPQPTPHRTRPMNARLDRQREFAAALTGSLHSIAEKVIGDAIPAEGRVQVYAKIGRASWRVQWCQSGEISGVDVTLKKKKQK